MTNITCRLTTCQAHVSQFLSKLTQNVMPCCYIDYLQLYVRIYNVGIFCIIVVFNYYEDLTTSREKYSRSGIKVDLLNIYFDLTVNAIKNVQCYITLRS